MFKQYLLMIIAIVEILTAESFNYGSNGPDTWFLTYPKCGTGQRQSPIDIQDGSVTYDPFLKSFQYGNYDKALKWKVTHDGKTIYFNPDHSDEDKLTFRTSSLGDELYRCLQFHFHWGENDYQGSEHLINSKKYPLEVHFVHQSVDNSSNYAVLGYIFMLSAVNNTNIDKVIAASSQVVNSTFSTVVDLIMGEFIPLRVRQSSYYRYAGSLTTPPCTEGIAWTLFETTIPISSAQLNAFHTNSQNKNYREPQPSYQRGVTSNRIISRSVMENGAMKMPPPSPIFILTFFILLIN